MLENCIPNTWQEWALLVQRALEPGPTISTQQLLYVRHLDGQLARRQEPPVDVVPRSAAVLILLYPSDNDLRLILTVRSELLTNHRGEVSLPGGSKDPEDAHVVATALREANEELGINTEQISIWGQLSPIYVAASNFSISPVVGFDEQPPILTPNHHEVSAVLTVSLRELLDPAIVLVEQWNLHGHEVEVPYFLVDGHKVWGATALILSELAARLRRALAATPIEQNL